MSSIKKVSIGPIKLYPAYRNGYSFRHGFDIYIGPWANRFKFDSTGRFMNGSSFSCGWFNWQKDIERQYGMSYSEYLKFIAEYEEAVKAGAESVE